MSKVTSIKELKNGRFLGMNGVGSEDTGVAELVIPGGEDIP